MPANHPPEVLLLLDDAAAGALLLELSCTLAQALQRDLGVVFVESSRSLVAAALPCTQVLPYSGAGWVPLSTQDVEQGFRAHAARLHTLAEQITRRHRVAWSLRIVRGSLDSAATCLESESDLLMLAGPAPRPVPVAARGHRRRTVVAVPRAANTSDVRALGVAKQLVQALQGVLETVQDANHAPAPTALCGSVLARTDPDVLVLPRLELTRERQTLWRCPVLLVG